MLVLVGKTMNEGVITGYRVLDLCVVNNQLSLQNSVVRTVDSYQVLQLLYTRDSRSNERYKFQNAMLQYEIDNPYVLEELGNTVVWSYYEKKSNNLKDRKVIPKYSDVDVSKLTLKPIGCDMWNYGIYPEINTPYVVLAMKYDSNNVLESYFVTDASITSASQIEEIRADLFIGKAQYRAAHFSHEGVANGVIQNNVFIPYGKVVELRNDVPNNTSNNAVPKPKRIPVPATQNPSRPVHTQQQVQNNRSSDGISAEATITIPASVTSLKDGVLLNNNIVEKLVLHSAVQSISPHSLLKCPRLKKFDVDADNAFLCSPGGILLSHNGFDMIRCPAAVGVEIRTIPKYVKTVCSGAFRGVSTIREMVIPDNVSVVEAGAFVGCANLEKVIVFAKEIREDAFVDCPKLHTLIIANGVEKITGTLIRNCPMLRVLVLPDSLKVIEPKVYKQWVVDGYINQDKEHCLIEQNSVNYIFAPPSILPYVQYLYTDKSMYDTRRGKQFNFCQNTEPNLLQFKLGNYLNYIR